MIDELLKLHEINHIISVDDCYFNPEETEVKAILSSSMNDSFSNYESAIEKMGKKDQLDNIVNMISISGNKVSLINSFLEEFSHEELLELYSFAPHLQTDKYTTEKNKLIGFLEKLKELHYIDGYDICASVKEAIDIDFMEMSRRTKGILWLIDRNFERVGEAPDAGIELAKTIVGRNEGPANYVYILSSLNEDTDKNEEEIEAEFDALLLGTCDKKTASFIYYLYKQRIRSDKLTKIEKGIAQGFKRKACFELFDLCIESLQKSVYDSSSRIREIRQDTLNYLFDEMVRENSESYLEFLTRLISIFQLDSYQAALATSNAAIVEKIGYYKQLCSIADDKAADKKKATEKVKVFREIELYNKHINILRSEVTTGDIFGIGKDYYFLASQPCDTCLRGDGARILDNASLLLLCDDSNSSSFNYKLSCFNDYSNPVIKCQSPLTFPFEILDLCVQNQDGKARLTSDLLLGVSEFDSKFYTERYSLRIKHIIEKLHILVNNSNILDDFFSNKKQIDLKQAQLAYEEIRMVNPELLKYSVEADGLEYDVQRICRLSELVTIDIVNMFSIKLSRIGHSFDFTQRTRRNS